MTHDKQAIHNQISVHRSNCVSAFRCSWSYFFLQFRKQKSWLCIMKPRPPPAVVPLVTIKPGGATLFIFFWLALHIFTRSQLGVSGVSRWSVFIQRKLFPLWFKAYHHPPPALSMPDLLLSTQTRRVLPLLILLLELSNTGSQSVPRPITEKIKKHLTSVTLFCIVWKGGMGCLKSYRINVLFFMHVGRKESCLCCRSFSLPYCITEGNKGTETL